MSYSVYITIGTFQQEHVRNSKVIILAMPIYNVGIKYEMMES